MQEKGAAAIAEVQAALAGLGQALAVDGYLLEVARLRDGVLTVRVVATEGACEECLPPKETLAGLIEVSLPDSLVVETVELAYPRE